MSNYKCNLDPAYAACRNRLNDLCCGGDEAANCGQRGDEVFNTQTTHELKGIIGYMALELKRIYSHLLISKSKEDCVEVSIRIAKSVLDDPNVQRSLELRREEPKDDELVTSGLEDDSNTIQPLISISDLIKCIKMSKDGKHGQM